MDSKTNKDMQALSIISAVRTDPFGENVSAEHAYRRGERIVGALYLITNHIQNDEPLRTRVRSIGHQLLGELLELRDGFRGEVFGKRGVILSNIREAISLVQMLAISGYVSEANVTLVAQALDDLGSFLSDSQHSPLSDGIHLKRDDFLPTNKTVTRATPPLATRENREVAPELAPPQHDRTVAKPAKKVGRAVQTEMHSERRDAIKDILARSGPLGIKDITSQMVNCSEKTVQRELAVLIKDMTVQKTGEKRWSTYSLTK